MHVLNWRRFAGPGLALTMMMALLLALPALGPVTVRAQSSDLIISGVIDGPLSGGVPKAIELYAVNDIADLSAYGLESANNGNPSSGPEYTFDAISASAGDFIYVASETTGFNDFFGFLPNATGSVASINGDDAILLFQNGAIVDVFGEVGVDGSGRPWEYTDGWAYRVDATGPDGSTFQLSNWTFSGPNALDGESSNATAATPFAIGSYTGGGDPPPPDVCAGAIPVADVQGSGDVTPLAGQEVTIRGIVTADFGSEIIVQELTGGLRSGMLVFSSGNGAGQGDDVCVTGVASERFGQTQIGGNGNPNATIDILSSNNSLPAPALVETAAIATGAATAEDYEAVLVRVENVTVTDPDLGFGEFLVDDGSGGTRVDDKAPLGYAPQLNDTFEAIVGPLLFSFSNYKISPRGPSDLIGLAGPPTGNCPVPPAIAKIHQIQGEGATVTCNEQVVSIEAIVVGDFQRNDQLRGFFVQEEDADTDDNPATSEGLFVFCSSCPVDVAVGDLVQVTGAAGDFFGMTQIAATGSADVTMLNSGNALPTPAGVALPVPGVPAGDLTAAEAAIDAYFEQFEGMLVNFPAQLTVAEYFQLGRFGQVVLTEGGRIRQFTDANLPDAAGLMAHTIDRASRTIILDDDNNTQNSPIAVTPDGPYFHPLPGLSNDNFFRGGDTIANLTGVLHWSFAGFSGTDAWRIRPVTEAFSYDFTAENSRPASPDDVGGNLKIASFNVLNYFTTLDDGRAICGPDATLGCRGANSLAELERQRDKIVSAIVEIDAAIVGLIEIENNPVDAALLDLVAGLNAATAPGTYAALETGSIGSDAIKVAFVYQPARVALVGDFAVLDTPEFVNPNTPDPKNRPALAQTFEHTATGEIFTVVVNHLKSKGSGCGVGDDDATTGQGNCNLTRTLAAQELADWLAGDPTASGDPDFMIIGDLNAYRNEDPIAALENAGYTDLIDSLLGSDAYSFVFDGQLGYLDHALANAGMLSQVSGVTEWSINADEINLFDYNDEIRDPGEASFERESAALSIYRPDAFRSSDHDPVIVGLNLEASVAALTIVKEANPAAPWLDWPFAGSGAIGDFMLDNDDGSETPDRLTFELAPGSYTVSETNRPGNWDLRIACDADFSVEGDSVTVNLAAGSELTCTFSNERRPQIRITKYEDLNQNGRRDQGEPGLKDWQMFLYISDGQGGWQQIQPREVRTRGNGTANYTNLEPGIDHLVCEEQRDGWRTSEPANPLEVDGRICQVVANLSYGEVRPVQFGNFQETMLYRARQVGARVWIERDVELAGLNDFDRDGDGWALVGRTNGAGNNGELRGFFMEGTFPYAVVFNNSRNKGNRCILVTPTSLEQVRKGQTRMGTTVQDPYINPEFGCEAP